MLLLFPFFLALQLTLAWRGSLAMGQEGLGVDLLLLSGGVVTVLPLLLFGVAARQLRLATVGLLQYISPTCQFVLAVLVFREPMTSDRLAAFALIWLALAIYSLESWRLVRQSSEPAASDTASATSGRFS